MTWNYSIPILSERDFERLSHLTITNQYQHSDVLERNLNFSRVFPCHMLPKSVVTMNSEVILQDIEARQRFKVTLVYPFNADPEIGRISVDSDFGSRMLGLQLGQTFLAKMEDGTIRKLAVISIPYQPEAAGTLE